MFLPTHSFIAALVFEGKQLIFPRNPTAMSEQGVSGQGATKPCGQALQTSSCVSPQASVQHNTRPWRNEPADPPRRTSEVAVELPQEPQGSQIQMGDT